MGQAQGLQKFRYQAFCKKKAQSLLTNISKTILAELLFDNILFLCLFGLFLFM